VHWSDGSIGCERPSQLARPHCTFSSPDDAQEIHSARHENASPRTASQSEAVHRAVPARIASRAHASARDAPFCHNENLLSSCNKISRRRIARRHRMISRATPRGKLVGLKPASVAVKIHLARRRCCHSSSAPRSMTFNMEVEAHGSICDAPQRAFDALDD
jgi:hypothetical protein